jgi:hypothetical protein
MSRRVIVQRCEAFCSGTARAVRWFLLLDEPEGLRPTAKIVRISKQKMLHSVGDSPGFSRMEHRSGCSDEIVQFVHQLAKLNQGCFDRLGAGHVDTRSLEQIQGVFRTPPFEKS